MTTENPTVKIRSRLGRHPNSLKNLEKGNRFKPGENNNPKGRPPRDYSITSQAKALIDKDPSIILKAAESWLRKVKLGLLEDRRDFQDRTEGKVPDKGTPLNDNRVLNIIVINQHTSDLIALVGERAKKLPPGETIGNSDQT